jgi:DNA topoisomerase-2
MRSSQKERITTPKPKKSYTKVSWIPDFEKFKIKNYSKNMIRVYYRYVYDAAMLTKVNVYLNDRKIPIKNLLDYSKCFGDGEVLQFKSKNCHVVLTPGSGNDFEHIAFTNGVFNKDGGVHVDAWSESIFRPLLAKVNKPKKPQLNIKDVKKFFRIFIDARIANPEFSSQSKTYLSAPKITTKVEKKQMSALFKWNVMEDIQDIIKSKELLTLKKKERKSKAFKKIDGFDPANNAGGKRSSECVLILCEGLSAKTYAVSGIQVGINGKCGRDWFGIYPLRGKLLNVRNATIKSISNNKEISDVIQALGVKHGVDYTKQENYEKLSYGSVLIMTDSDVDGIHISSLIMNFFHYLFPSLLKRSTPFITSMQTPIVKLFLSKKKELVFYQEEHFREYQQQNPEVKGKIKYYKGLGTSSDTEIKATFGKKIVNYVQDTDTDANMNKVFHTKSSDLRKKWLKEYDPDLIHIPNNSEQYFDMNYSDFIDTQHIKFSIDDCGRSIPNIMDGLKESQRKILYAAFLKNLKYSGSTLKVAQLAGFVAEKTNYHHGEQCLFETITKMAQDFPGSNNIPFFYRDGQFGSRLNGGKDAANARYIFTKLNRLTRLLFPSEFDVLLSYKKDDGECIEPEFYLPIIPTVLVNGCNAGIGTGWSCNIPSYNPIEIVDCVRTWLKNETVFEDAGGNDVFSALPELLPYYRGYTGKIEKVSDTKFVSYGVCEREKTKRSHRDKVTIVELPVQVWTDKFKEQLEELLERKMIKSLKNYSTPKKVKFEIIENDELKCDVKTLKMHSYLYCSNMVLFDENGRIQKYETVDDIIEHFCNVRFQYYVAMKKHCLEVFSQEIQMLSNKIRFLQEVMDDKLVIYRRDYDEIVAEMTSKGYNKKNDSFDYLLNMNIRSFTKQKLAELQKELDKKTSESKKLKATSEKKLWLRDLKRFEDEYIKWDRKN